MLRGGRRGGGEAKKTWKTEAVGRNMQLISYFAVVLQPSIDVE